MIVEIKNTDISVGVKAGQIYKARRYWLEPDAKVTLLKRLSKKGKTMKKNVMCNQYISNVIILKKESNE